MTYTLQATACMVSRPDVCNTADSMVLLRHEPPPPPPPVASPPSPPAASELQLETQQSVPPNADLFESQTILDSVSTVVE